MAEHLEEVDSCTRRLTFQLDGGDVSSRIRDLVHEFSKKANMPGFRRGKIPKNVIQKKYGTEILNEAIHKLVDEWKDSVETQRVYEMVGAPVLENYVLNDSTSNYDVTVLYEVVPEVTAFDIADCKVIRPKVTVTDEDLDIETELWFKESPDWDIADRPAQHGDKLFVRIDHTDHRTGQKSTGNIDEIRLVEDKCSPEILSACIGKSVDEIANAVIYEESDDGDSEAKAKRATFHLKILNVMQPIPDSLDRELLGTLQVESPQDENFRDAAKKFLEDDIRNNIESTMESQVLEHLTDRNPFETPLQMKKYVMMTTLVNEGVAPEQARNFVQQSNPTGDWFQRYMNAAVVLKRKLLFDGIREYYDMQIDDEKVQESVEKAFEEYASQNSESENFEQNSQYYRDFLYNSMRSAAERENIKQLVEKLIETSDCEEIEMNLREYRAWHEEFFAAPETSDEDIADESDESGENEEDQGTSLILDEYGNPIEK